MSSPNQVVVSQVNEVTTVEITTAGPQGATGATGAQGPSISDGDKGDITVSNSGATFTIDNDVVTYAKIQNVSATDRVLGRDSSGAGVIEEITPANLRTMLNVEDGATTDQTASEIKTLLQSDKLTVNEIADDAVTADKLANSINTEITANTAKTSNATHTGEVTGSTALTIADNVVDEANLKVSNTPTNGYVLTAQSGNTGGLTWAAQSGGGGGGSVDSVSGTAPIVSSGGTDPAISISAATTSAAGSMSSSDKSKLDGIESNATADQTKSDIDALNIAAFTATKLAATKTIAGVAFDGSANISLNNNAITNGAGYTTNTGTVTGVSGTAPIASSGGATPVISISAATTSDAGSMSSADKTKLDGIETSADVTDATNVASSGAVMDGDFTSNGFLKRTGAGSYTVDTNTYLTAVPSGYLQNISEDSSPQLGGNLDVQASEITTSTSNGNIKLNPNGTGVVEVKGDGSSADGTLQLNCSQNSHGIKLKSPPHSAGASYTLTFPNTDGSANQVLKTDGSGGLDWVDQSGDTTYSAGTGLNLSSTTFSADVGIADDKIVQIDDADAADDDYAKFTANGLEGRSYAEVKTDLSLNNVENTAISTFTGSTNITTLGAVATVTSTASGTAGVRKIYASTSSPSGGSDGDIWIKHAA